jgi:hypothetical protein
LAPGIYFRVLLIGYFEGLDSERGIAWRAADSFALRDFLGLCMDKLPPDHSTISRTRRLIDLETHRSVFTWILQVLATADLVKGKTIGIDATTLEANAALRSIAARLGGDLSGVSDATRPGPRALRRPRGRTWRDWIGSARRKAAIKIGAIRRTPTRASRR